MEQYRQPVFQLLAKDLGEYEQRQRDGITGNFYTTLAEYHSRVSALNACKKVREFMSEIEKKLNEGIIE